MFSLFLTQTGGILGPFATVLGWILNAIYEFMSLFGIENIAICIIIFTFVTKMLMLPLTIKQQRFSKMSAVMNPEIQAVQAKYQGKKDEASMRRQQMELQEIYSKYGSSPTAGCLPLLISLPIMFALYRVIYAVPAYVNDVYDLYESVAQLLQPLEGYADYLMNTARELGVSTSNFAEYGEGSAVLTVNHIIDILTKFTQESWAALGTQFPQIADALQPLSDQIIHINSFLAGMNILDSPGIGFPGIIIPLAAAGSQLLQTKLMNSANSSSRKDDQSTAAASMKMMNTIMPIMSGVFCIMLPIGVGLYWVASSVFTILQQLVINKYIDRMDLDEMIEKNVMKANKKKAKLGIDTGSKMAEVAKTSTKSIERKYEEKSTSSYANAGAKKNYDSYKRSDVSYSAGSIAANANILRDRNKEKDKEKDKDKGDK